MADLDRVVFEQVNDGLLVLTDDGVIVEANPAACDMHGYPRGELVGQPVQRLIDPGHLHRWDDFVLGLHHRGTVAFRSVDHRWNGEAIEVQVHGARFVHRGRPAMLAVISDVTEHNAALRQQRALSSKILMAQEEERSRVSRDLHDGLGQLLAAMRFEMDWIQRGQHDPGAPADFGELARLLERAATELREICEELRPPLLDELGLELAVRELCEHFHSRHCIAVDLDLRLGAPGHTVPTEVAVCCFRVTQEALHNARRHGSPRRVAVSMATTARGLVVSIHDNGKGFVPGQPGQRTGLGIAGMEERARLVGGALEIRSARGEGTRVVLTVPHPGRRIHVRHPPNAPRAAPQCDAVQADVDLPGG